MFVFYKLSTGAINFTMNSDSYPDHLVTEEVEVIETSNDLGDIACWRVIDGALTKVTIAPIRTTYLAKIAQTISTVRAKYITVIAGQDMIYLRKEQEAISYLNATNPVLSQYPMIAAEVGITAPTPYEVAQIWLYMSNAWQYVAAGLEAVRMTATNAVLNATTEEEVVTAYATFEATLVATGA
jgi:hypothetical protein